MFFIIKNACLYIINILSNNFHIDAFLFRCCTSKYKISQSKNWCQILAKTKVNVVERNKSKIGQGRSCWPNPGKIEIRLFF